MSPPQKTKDEELVVMESGHGSHALDVSDLVRSQKLADKFRSLQLKEYFDEHGNARYQQLGFSFAAKQNRECASTFGSTTNEESQRRKAQEQKSLSARQYRRARAAIEKDEERVKEERKKAMQLLEGMEQHRTADVENHQRDMLFWQVPDYKQYIPAGIELTDLLPIDMSKHEELQERRNMEKQNVLLEDSRNGECTKQGWCITDTEAKPLVRQAKLWNYCARGANNPNGMDRATFCSFIVDIDLVDSKHAPYFWILNLFDESAKPARCCPADATWADQASYAHTICWWSLIALLHKVLKQKFNAKAKEEFLVNLENTLKEKLPSSLTGEGGPRRSSDLSGSANMRGSFMMGKRVSLDENGFNQSAFGHTPAWLQPPEMPASNIDIDKEILQRKRLIQSMLLEPETLQITAQRVELFSALFDEYSDDMSGHMTFTDLLQFCSDFQLTPKLVSSQFLWDAYQGSHCIEFPPEPDPNDPRSLALAEEERIREKKAESKRKGKGRKTTIRGRGAPEEQKPPTTEELEQLEVFRQWCLKTFDGSPKVAFKHFDMNGNGTVSRQEFVDRGIQPPIQKIRGKKVSAIVLAKDTLADVFHALDQDRNGKGLVGWSEFVASQWHTQSSQVWCMAAGVPYVPPPTPPPPPPPEPTTSAKTKMNVNFQGVETEKEDEKAASSASRSAATIHAGSDTLSAPLQPKSFLPPASPKEKTRPNSREALFSRLEEWRLWCLEVFQGSPTKAFRHFDRSANGFVTRSMFIEQASVPVRGAKRPCPGDPAVHKKLFYLLNSDSIGSAGKGYIDWAGFVGAQYKTPCSAQWEQAASSRNSQMSGPKGCFGLPAFVETILKVGFVHLHAYGNGVQQSLTARGRTIWLLAYLHYVFSHLQKSRMRRTGGTAKTRLDKVLKKVDPALFTNPPIELMTEVIPTPPVAPQATAAVPSSPSQMGPGGKKALRHTVSASSKLQAEQQALLHEQQMLKQKQEESKAGEEEADGKVDEPLMRSPLWLLMTNAQKKKKQLETNDDEARYDIERMELTPPPLGVFGEDFRVRLKKMLEKENLNRDDPDDDDWD